MNRTIVAAGSLAAVVLLAVIGFGLVSGGGMFGPGATASPSPTPAPSPTQAPTATPVPTASPIALRLGLNAVGAGTYMAELQGMRYTVTVPETDFGATFAGWDATLSDESWGITWDGQGSIPNFSSMWIYSDVSTLYAEPCLWEGSNFTPGPTVNDLATALEGLDGFISTAPAEVTIAGYTGQRLQMVVPSSVSPETCQQAMYQSFEGKGAGYGSAGQTDDIRIVDLDGTRHVLVTHYQLGTPEEAVTALNAMLESIRIEPI